MADNNITRMVQPVTSTTDQGLHELSLAANYCINFSLSRQNITSFFWLMYLFYRLPINFVAAAMIREHWCVIFSVRCNIYISRLYYDVSVRLSVTEVH